MLNILQIVDFGCHSIGVAKIARRKRSSEVGKGDLGVMIVAILFIDKTSN